MERITRVLGMSAAVLRADALRLPLADASVDLIVTSPPYFALRSYRDEGGHYANQIGSEETPQAFLEALWAVTAECHRVLKPSGSMWVNLGDKYAGSGGHNNAGISDKSTLRGNGHVGGMGKAGPQKVKSTLRSGPDRYNQDSGGVLAKSLLGLPWRYAIGCIDGMAAPGGQRWILRAEVIWSKPNGLPESVTDRVRRSHETWFHLVKSPRYFAAVDEVRESHEAAPSSNTRPAPNKGMLDNGVNGGRAGGYTRDGWIPGQPNPLGKLPGSVWTVPSEPLIIPEAVARHYDLPDHFAAFPQEWPRRIILGWSPVGGVVLDPFMGTGTTLGVARALGRFGVGVDLSWSYCRLAAWRVFRSKHFAKAAQRTHRENQGDLFGNAPSYEDVEVTEAL